MHLCMQILNNFYPSVLGKNHYGMTKVIKAFMYFQIQVVIHYYFFNPLTLSKKFLLQFVFTMMVLLEKSLSNTKNFLRRQTFIENLNTN